MIQVFKHNPNAKIPTRAFPNDAGLDLYSIEDVNIPLGSTVTVDTGIAISIPEGYVGKIEDRSSLARRGLRVGGGIIDPGFTGSIKVIIHNITDSDSLMTQDGAGFYTIQNGAVIKAGDKIAQILIQPVDTTGIIETKYIWNSSRGSNGFGSSGS